MSSAIASKDAVEEMYIVDHSDTLSHQSHLSVITHVQSQITKAYCKNNCLSEMMISLVLKIIFENNNIQNNKPQGLC